MRGKTCRDINIISVAVGRRKTLERHWHKNASPFHRLLRCVRNILYQFLSTFAFVYRYFVILLHPDYISLFSFEFLRSNQIADQWPIETLPFQWNVFLAQFMCDHYSCVCYSKSA